MADNPSRPNPAEIDVAAEAGVYVPTLCYLKDFRICSTTGSCDLGDLPGVVCSLAWRATLAHPAISRNGCRLCNTRDDLQPMQVPRPVCDLRPKSCLEPDRTLIDRIEKCSPAQHFALNAVNGYLDFVSGSRDDGGDARCHDAVARLNR